MLNSTNFPQDYCHSDELMIESIANMVTQKMLKPKLSNILVSSSSLGSVALEDSRVGGDW
jgi:hypothetical protein